MMLKRQIAIGRATADGRPSLKSCRCNTAPQRHYNARNLSKVVHHPRDQRPSSSVTARQREGVISDTGIDRRALLLGLLAGGQLLQLQTSSPVFAATSQIETVFVAGSTGNTGRRVVQQLREAGFKVRAGVRDEKKAQGLGFAFDKGITIVQADVTKDAKTLGSAIGDAQAVICATGYAGFNPLGVGSVDETGTIHLIDAAKAQGVRTFVLQSSLLTNAVAVGQKGNPNYKFLNLFGGVLDHKLAAERYLRSSGLQYTIVRPGGLSNDPPSAKGNLFVSGEDTLFGLESDPGRAISRDTVAAVLVAALRQPAAANKVVEIVASPTAAELPEDKWFAV